MIAELVARGRCHGVASPGGAHIRPAAMTPLLEVMPFVEEKPSNDGTLTRCWHKVDQRLRRWPTLYQDRVDVWCWQRRLLCDWWGKIVAPGTSKASRNYSWHRTPLLSLTIPVINQVHIYKSTACYSLHAIYWRHSIQMFCLSFDLK